MITVTDENRQEVLEILKANMGRLPNGKSIYIRAKWPHGRGGAHCTNHPIRSVDENEVICRWEWNEVRFKSDDIISIDFWG